MLLVTTVSFCVEIWTKGNVCLLQLLNGWINFIQAQLPNFRSLTRSVLMIQAQLPNSRSLTKSVIILLVGTHRENVDGCCIQFTAFFPSNCLSYSCDVQQADKWEQSIFNCIFRSKVPKWRILAVSALPSFGLKQGNLGDALWCEWTSPPWSWL